MTTSKSPPNNAPVRVHFEPAFDDQEPLVKGPYRFVHLIHGTLRAAFDGDEELAHYENGWWVTPDGQKWEDVVIWGE